jgi:prepilin-type N-terminal cleavage/methylation domain-containing protein
MKERRFRGSQQGFTLIEIIAVMVILSVLASISAAKVIEADTTAKWEAMAAAISDLNSRERVTWAKVKLSNDNWQNDNQVFTLVDTYFGPEYRWQSVGASGGVLDFKGISASLTRTPSTFSQPAVWKTD